MFSIPLTWFSWHSPPSAIPVAAEDKLLPFPLAERWRHCTCAPQRPPPVLHPWVSLTPCLSGAGSMVSFVWCLVSLGSVPRREITRCMVGLLYLFTFVYECFINILTSLRNTLTHIFITYIHYFKQSPDCFHRGQASLHSQQSRKKTPEASLCVPGGSWCPPAVPAASVQEASLPSCRRLPLMSQHTCSSSRAARLRRNTPLVQHCHTEEQEVSRSTCSDLCPPLHSG